jgi:peptidoglycan hydrolase CwlO-like protein
VRQNKPLQLLRSERFKLASRPDETRAEFLGRLVQLAREQRDAEVEKLRRRYADKFAALKDRLLRAEQAVMREQEQLSAKKVETAISFGTAILGAFLGRKAISAGSAGRLGTAMKSAGRLKKESADRERAQESVDALKAKLAEMDQALQAEVDALEGAFDPAAETLQETAIAATPTGIAQQFFGLVWLPYRRDEQGKAFPVWKGATP